MRPELDDQRLEEFERSLSSSTTTRIGAEALWSLLARVFPHRASGPAERHLLLETLMSLEARGSIRLPPRSGKRWDRTMDPPVPTSVDVVRDRPDAAPFPWRTFPWHPVLNWVSQCRSLSLFQVDFLRRVHDGFVNRSFCEPAPIKYRSLQLTGDEKMLASLATTALFGPSRLTFDLLGCLPDAVPLAWEVVGTGGRMVIFENAGPFAVARRVLGELQSRPYDLIAYGGGRNIVAGLGHLLTIDRQIESLHYVGDIDDVGLDIAWNARICAARLGLPALQPASEIHRQMLAAASAFGHGDGWPARVRLPDVNRARLLDSVAPDVRPHVERIVRAGQRIPEEVLGPAELRKAWTGIGVLRRY